MKYKIFQNSDKIIKFQCETLKFGEKFKPNAQRIAFPLPPNRTGVQRGQKCTFSNCKTGELLYYHEERGQALHF